MTRFGADDVPAMTRGARLRVDRARARTVLLAPETLYELDETAAAVLGLVDGERSVACIVSQLAVRYAADAALIQNDVIELLDALAQKRVLERRQLATGAPDHDA